MNDFRTFATALLLAAAPALGFAADGPRLIGGGDNTQVVYDGGYVGDVVGGGPVALQNSVTGNRPVAYGTPTVQAAGPVATLTGGGDNTALTYAPAAAPSATRFANRR